MVLVKLSREQRARCALLAEALQHAARRLWELLDMGFPPRLAVRLLHEKSATFESDEPLPSNTR